MTKPNSFLKPWKGFRFFSVPLTKQVIISYNPKVDSPYWFYKKNRGYNPHSKWDGPLVCTSFPATSNDGTSNQCLCDLPLGLGTNFFENSFHGLKKSFGEWTHFGSLGNLTRPTRKPNVTGSEFRYHQKGNMRGYQHAIQNGSRVLSSF